jgi:hypothetical protein
MANKRRRGMVEEEANCGLHGICAQSHIWNVKGCIMMSRSTAVGFGSMSTMWHESRPYGNDTRHLNVTETLFEDSLHLTSISG